MCFISTVTEATRKVLGLRRTESPGGAQGELVFEDKYGNPAPVTGEYLVPCYAGIPYPLWCLTLASPR